jgi:hypothetical protein
MHSKQGACMLVFCLWLALGLLPSQAKTRKRSDFCGACCWYG